MITVLLSPSDVVLIRAALDAATVKGPAAMRALVALTDALPAPTPEGVDTPTQLTIGMANALIEVLNVIPVTGLDSMNRTLIIARRVNDAGQEYARAEKSAQIGV